MNTDKVTSWSGIIAAIGVAVIDYYNNLGPDGLNLKSPIFWVGLGVAALMALQAYFTNKE